MTNEALGNVEMDSENFFLEALMQNHPDAIYFKDRESRFLKVNKVFIIKHGFAKESEVLGKTDFDLFPIEHAQKAFDDEQRIIKTGKALINIEEHAVRLGGDAYIQSVSKMPLKDADGHIIGTYGISRDITEFKKQERLILEQNSILLAITNKMPIVIYRYSSEKGLYNELGCIHAIKAFKRSKTAKLSINESLYHTTGRIGDSDEEFQNFSCTGIDEKGEPVYFDNYIFEDSSMPGEFIGLAIDITEDRKYEQNLKRDAKKLEKLNKELSDFAYIISHDLKAPLRAITNLSEWIEEDLKDSGMEEVKENLGMMRSRALRMESLINGILSYSRVTTESNEIEDVDVAQVITEVVDDLLINENFKIEMETSFPTVTYSKVNLIQIYSNLLSNAVKYHHKGEGTIRVGCIDGDEYFQFYVHDDGPGIKEAYREKIFKIFQTLQSRDTFESTGVGLAIVRKVVEQRGGSVYVEDSKDPGTRFVFTIPKKSI